MFIYEFLQKNFHNSSLPISVMDRDSYKLAAAATASTVTLTFTTLIVDDR